MKKLAIVNIGGNFLDNDFALKIATYVGTYYKIDVRHYQEVFRILSVYYLHGDKDFFYTEKLSKMYLDSYAREVGEEYQYKQYYKFLTQIEKLESVGIFDISVIDEFIKYSEEIKELTKKEAIEEKKYTKTVDPLYLEARKREYEAIKEANESLKEAVESIKETKKLTKKKSN